MTKVGRVNDMTTTSPEPWVPPDTFAHRLRVLRAELDLTVEQIARECDLKPATWSTWENGRMPHNITDVVQKINAGTGVDRDWLMWGSHNPPLMSLSVVPYEGQRELPGISPSPTRALIAVCQ